MKKKHFMILECLLNQHIIQVYTSLVRFLFSSLVFVFSCYQNTKNLFGERRLIFFCVIHISKTLLLDNTLRLYIFPKIVFYNSFQEHESNRRLSTTSTITGFIFESIAHWLKWRDQDRTRKRWGRMHKRTRIKDVKKTFFQGLSRGYVPW